MVHKKFRGHLVVLPLAGTLTGEATGANAAWTWTGTGTIAGKNTTPRAIIAAAFSVS
jgi:hypothetical protein